MVSTVVVRSGTASVRTVALRTPIASASSATIESPEPAFGCTSMAMATAAAAPTSATSIPSAA